MRGLFFFVAGMRVRALETTHAWPRACHGLRIDRGENADYDLTSHWFAGTVFHQVVILRAASGGGLFFGRFMSGSDATPFSCPHCAAAYKLVHVEAEEKATDPNRKSSSPLLNYLVRAYLQRGWDG
jgi:hypothetical protein